MLYNAFRPKNLLLTLFAAGFAVASLSLASAAHAQSSDRAAEIRALLEQRDRQIKDVLGSSGSLSDAQREKLKTYINGFVDFRAMGRTALGPHWSDLTEAQKTEFVDLFSTIVRSQSLSNLEPYRAKVSYDQIDVNGNEAHVVTSTVYKGEPIKVEYDLQYEGDTWAAHDIILDGVSTVGGYERSFQTVVRKKGFDALMSSLRKKRDQIAVSS